MPRHPPRSHWLCQLHIGQLHLGQLPPSLCLAARLIAFKVHSVIRTASLTAGFARLATRTFAHLASCRASTGLSSGSISCLLKFWMLLYGVSL